MLGNYVIPALLIAIVGAAALTCCILRFYTVFSAMSLGHRRRRHPEDASVEADGEGVFHDGFLKELRAASSGMALALFMALLLLAGLWLIGTRAEQETCLLLAQIFELSACGLFVIAQFTKVMVRASLPASFGFRSRLNAAMKHMNFTLLLLAALYAAACWVGAL